MKLKAEEMLKKQEVHQIYIGGVVFEMVKSNQAKKAAIEFAKLHVEAALKATAEMGKENWDWTTEECNSITEDSYPLDQIK